MWPFFLTINNHGCRLMDEIRARFYEEYLLNLHSSLLTHDLAYYFSGEGIKVDGVLCTKDQQFSFQALEQQIDLKMDEFAQLFIVFNGSRVHMQHEDPKGRDGAPEGFYIKTINNELLHPYKNSIGIFREESGELGITIDGLHIDTFMLKEDAPEMLGTIGFCFCALTAYLKGFTRIDLVAAGRTGPKDKNIGYIVWPKLGFDAALEQDDRKDWPPQYAQCISVQEIMKIDEDYWKQNGFQMLMSFDLSPDSSSWSKLLDYTRRKQLWS